MVENSKIGCANKIFSALETMQSVLHHFRKKTWLYQLGCKACIWWKVMFTLCFCILVTQLWILASDCRRCNSPLKAEPFCSQAIQRFPWCHTSLCSEQRWGHNGSFGIGCQSRDLSGGIYLGLIFYVIRKDFVEKLAKILESNWSNKPFFFFLRDD